MTKGKIVNKKTGLEIPGVRQTSHTSYMLVKIDGTATGNTFSLSEWDFIADTPALPTVPGLYKAWLYKAWPEDHLLLLLSGKGEWHWMDGDIGKLFPVIEVKNLSYYAKTMVKVEV